MQMVMDMIMITMTVVTMIMERIIWNDDDVNGKDHDYDCGGDNHENADDGCDDSGDDGGDNDGDDQPIDRPTERRPTHLPSDDLQA